MALADPIAAQEAVHDAAMAAWLAGGDWPIHSLDAAFRRHLETAACTAIRSAAGGDRAGDEGREAEAAAALLALSPADRFGLAREYGLPPEPVSAQNPLARRLSQRSSSRRLARFSAALGAASDGAAVQALLRALYAARDPGDEAPLALRLRLARSLSEAEAAAAERARKAEGSGWGFAINSFVAIVAITAAIALTSVTGARAGAQVTADSPAGPGSPLAIAAVTVIQGGIAGPGVHVASTRDTLLATFSGSTDWHPEARQCLPDVAGVVDAAGRVQWLGQSAGHVASLAGDPTSANAYAFGLSEYCQTGSHTSIDGGNAWSSGPVPPGTTSTSIWLAFDPAVAGTLLGAGDGRLLLSRDAGRTWTSSPEKVVPLGFTATGRLYGWGPGAIFESGDDGASWQQVATGPASAPTAAAALAGGVLVGEPDGLWWYPLDGAPSLVQRGMVFSVTAAGDGAIAVGSDAASHPWLGTCSPGAAPASLATYPLPADVASLVVTGGDVAANSSGAAVAFSGSSSAIAFVAFAP
jgi:hypothetical protein